MKYQKIKTLIKRTLGLLLLFLPSTIFCQNDLTIGEVFNYEIGDEFQSISYHYPNPQSLRRFAVMDKYFTNSGKTVNYKREYSNWNLVLVTVPFYHMEYRFQYFEEVRSYSNLDSNIRKYSGYYDDQNDSIGNYYSDTIYFSNELCSGNVFKYHACLACNFEGTSYEGIYREGLGEIYYKTAAYADQELQVYTLIYFKKGAFSCGTPSMIFEGVNDFGDANIQLNVSPNPTSDYLNIDFQNSEPCEILLLSMDGRTIKQEKSNSLHYKMDVSALEKGVYLLKVSDENRSKIMKVVIQ